LTIGIKPNHAAFTECDGDIFLEPVDEGADEALFVNGENVTEPVMLNHLDRIIFGTNSVFLFRHPEKARREGITVPKRKRRSTFPRKSTFDAEQLEKFRDHEDNS
jgi:pSer/pThr/pTyr-binding forkhead associated (FHA) protein